MPEIRFPRLEHGSVWPTLPGRQHVADCAALRAVMYYPDQEAERVAFVDAVEHYHVLENALWDGRLLPERSVEQDWRYAWAGTPEALANAEAHVGWHGEFAGRAVLYVLANGSSVNEVYKRVGAESKKKAQQPPRQPGLNKAAFKGFKSSNLRQNVWSPYKPVAHLWASLIYMRSQRPCLYYPDTLRRFLEMAEALRMMGEAYASPRSRRTLLDPKHTWRLPPDIKKTLGPPPTISLSDIGDFDPAEVVHPHVMERVAAQGHHILPTWLGWLGQKARGDGEYVKIGLTLTPTSLPF